MYKLITLAILSSCLDYGLTKQDASVPIIWVSPNAIDFGELEVPTSDTVTVFVGNSGGTTLLLDETVALFETEHFVVTPILNTRLAPDEITTFTITYAPTAYIIDIGRVVISSNSDNGSKTPIPIIGMGAAPEITIIPNTYDFNVYVGCDDERAIRIYNTGNVPLIVSDLNYFMSFPSYFSIDLNIPLNGELPWTILPDQYTTLYISYSPENLISGTAYLEVLSNDPINPAMQTTQTGTGLFGQIVQDNFEQNTDIPVDLLFIVDNSCSMIDYQAELSSNAESFLDLFYYSGTDYHLAVITTDSSDFRGAMIDTTYTFEAAKLEFMDQTDVGIYGSAVERGLYEAYLATRSGADAGPGSLFLREDARLALFFLSDEQDQSYSSYSTYVAAYQALKTDPTLVIAHAIAGDYPKGCPGATFGKGYYETVNSMSGEYLSICDPDWGVKMESLARASVLQKTFPLSGTPLEGTITVFVDGIAVSDWTYNALNNTVSFDEVAIPDDGSIITIEYAILGCLE